MGWGKALFQQGTIQHKNNELIKYEITKMVEENTHPQHTKQIECLHPSHLTFSGTALMRIYMIINKYRNIKYNI